MPRRFGGRAMWQAAEVTRAVFLVLARRARRLRKNTVLAGWLFHVTAVACRKLFDKALVCGHQSRRVKPLLYVYRVLPQPDIWRLPYGHVRICCGSVPGLPGRVLRWLIELNFSRFLTKALLHHAGSGTGRIKMMKRYLVFTYYVGRSCGGMKDLLDSFDSMAEAQENLLSEPTRYYQIVDRETLEIVKEGLTMFKDYDPEFFSRD